MLLVRMRRRWGAYIKEAFWLDLDETVEKIPKNERVVVGVHLNGH